MQFLAYVIRANESQKVVYCGITTQSLRIRWNRHKKSKFAIGSAIRKYGADAFSIDLIAESWSFEDLKVLEQQLIEQYGTFGRGGYNLTRGGDGVLGITFSDEVRARFSRDRKGRVWTEAQKSALRAIKATQQHPMLGKRHSAEAIAKIKKNRSNTSGERNHFYGKTHTPEAIEKIRENNRTRRLTAEQLARRSGENSARFGVRHTDETKRRMSEKQRGENNPNFGKPWSEERRAKHMATLEAKRLKDGVKNAVR
ncbi:NUMOD3 domain-containing DNA-binding protein [Burkholderia gladioli]|uniref:NUMOD3 domain-containing DNA-binding protein n=1 Tax=Burkholderia gladioli TaxID=28095 RepID=UPI003AFB0C9B